MIGAGKLLAAVLIILSCAEFSSAAVVDDIKFTFYGGAAAQTYTVSNLATILQNTNYAIAKKTVFYMYGFTQGLTSASVKEVVAAYATSAKYNLIVVSTPLLNYNLFYAKAIGEGVATGLVKLLKAGQNEDNIHLVGFSLGGQIVGVAGRYVTIQTDGNYVLGRITGLDPGIISTVQLALIEQRLNLNDAKFVDTIHTECKQYGSAETLGVVNFWINGGISQPMCTSILPIIAQTCSHEMAPKYWSESVRVGSTTSFAARKCNNYDQFKANTCDAAVAVAYMGINTSTEIRGNYYLSTNLASPYSK